MSSISKRGVRIPGETRRKLSMPLYMDRHDLSGMNEEELAAAHDRDVAIQHAHGAM